MGAAELALWTREHSLTLQDIRSALWERRTLVKTSCMRGTLHILAAADFPVYMSALKTSRIRQSLQIMARYGVTETEAFRVRDAVAEALVAGPRTRRKLTEEIPACNILGKKARAWFELSWWGVIRQAAAEGLICYGPDRGQEATIVRVDQWLPNYRTLPEAEAQKILLRRYLKSYGPATVQDFARWSGFSMIEARGIWGSLKEELSEVQIERTKAFLLRDDCERLRKARLREPVVRLLPNFDPYMLGHAAKDHLVDLRHYKQVYRNQGWISPVVLLNGRVVGIWSVPRGAKRLPFEVAPFEKFSRTVHSKIVEEAASLGDFLGGTVDTKFSG
jgi:hypothetical protein